MTSTPVATGSIALMKVAVRSLTQRDIGYDQWNRWSFFKGGKLISGPTAADCSSMCGAIAKLGGYDVDLTGTFYTVVFAAKLKAAGFEVFQFVSTEQMRDGDFVVAPGKHVEFQYGKRDGLPGVWWYSARNDEKGGLGGGKPGNQGGKENVGWGRPYDMSRGGTRDAYIVRPPDSKAPTVVSTLPKGPQGTLRRGGPKRANSIGTRVYAVQKRLNSFGYELEEDGVFAILTERAVKDFQKRRGFAAADIDGQWGQRTGDESLRARAEGWTIHASDE